MIKLFQEINLLAQLNQLIRQKATGTPKQLGRLLRLSERQARRVITDLKDRGVPIEYDKKRRSYFYERPVFMKFEIFVVEGEEKTKILGGEKNNFDFLKKFYQTDIF